MPDLLDAPATPGFGLDHLPYGVFSTPDGGRRVGVRYGDAVVDLTRLESHGLIAVAGVGRSLAFETPTLNAFMARGADAWDAVRGRLQDLLAAGGDPALRASEDILRRALVPVASVAMHLPAAIGDYTDFYSSRQHATNVGTMFRGAENALMPNWLHLPVGYHGRASSVVVSGTPVRRPSGQHLPAGASAGEAAPVFGPSTRLDIELELGAFVGPGNRLGEPVPMREAADQIFGYVLVNDWSARDLQQWEYVPLGPFLGKNFATSISPWVVPAAALAPFRVAGEPQTLAAGNPEPLPYLRQAEPRGLDVALTVALDTAAMRDAGEPPAEISRANTRFLYWSPEQQLVHHAVGGCNLRPGDLLASGTISGETEDSYGSLLELTWKGERPLALPGGEERRFLADGDRVILSGRAERDGHVVDFGTVEGTIAPTGHPDGAA